MSVLVGILVLSSCAQSRQVETPPPQEEESFRIKLSRWGFNNIPGEFLLEVEEGQEVEIIFVYGDSDLSQNNPHIISAPDYGITTGILDEENPEVILRFTATETGAVAFMCVLPECIGHHNLHTVYED